MSNKNIAKIALSLSGIALSIKILINVLSNSYYYGHFDTLFLYITAIGIIPLCSIILWEERNFFLTIFDKKRIVNILYVEDDALTRQQISKLLTSTFNNANVMSASSAKEATLLSSYIAFDLVITDMKMEDQLSGNIVCKYIKFHSKFTQEKIFVVLLSGDTREACEGFDLVLDKSLSPAEYTKKILKLASSNGLKLTKKHD